MGLFYVYLIYSVQGRREGRREGGGRKWSCKFRSIGGFVNSLGVKFRPIDRFEQKIATCSAIVCSVFFGQAEKSIAELTNGNKAFPPPPSGPSL